MRRFTFGDFPFGRTQLKPQVRHLREELKMSRAEPGDAALLAQQTGARTKQQYFPDVFPTNVRV